MTLDEAIKHCEEIAEDQNKLCERCDRASGYSRSHNEAIRTQEAKEYEKCSQDFRQLAEWLRELKGLKEQESILDKIRAEIEQTDFDFGDFYDHTDTIIQIVLEIIDKYRTESKGKE